MQVGQSSNFLRSHIQKCRFWLVDAIFFRHIRVKKKGEKGSSSRFYVCSRCVRDALLAGLGEDGGEAGRSRSAASEGMYA